LAASLGLPGLEIFDVAVEEDGSWTWHVTAAGDGAVCCPDCGQVSGSPVEPVIQQVKHLVVVPVRVAWHKARFRCDAVGCARVRFTQTGGLTVPAGRVSTHARQMMGHLVGDWLVPVSRVAAGAGVAWHTAHEGLAQVAADASIVVTDTKTDPVTDPVTEVGAAVTSTDGNAESGVGPGLAVRAIRSVSGVLPPVTVLGIDDHRRGKPLYHRDPASGVWVADADRWQSVGA
jgi:transposase